MRVLAIKIGLLVLIVSVLMMTGGSASVLASFESRHLLSALYVQPIVLMGLFVQGVRHAVLIDRPNLTYITATKAVTLAQGLNLLIPARLAEFLKATYLRDRAQVSISVGLSAVLLERTVDLIIVGTLGLICLFFFAAMVNKVLVVGLVLVALVIIMVALWGRRGIYAFSRLLPWPRLAAFIEQAYAHFGSILRQGQFFVGLILGLIAWALSYANVAILLSVAGDVPVGAFDALLVFVSTTIGGAVPALPGGVGAYEAAAVFALMPLGYPFHEALALAITIHAAQLVLPLLLSLLLLVSERVGLAGLIADVRKTMAEPRHKP